MTSAEAVRKEAARKEAARNKAAGERGGETLARLLARYGVSSGKLWRDLSASEQSALESVAEDFEDEGAVADGKHAAETELEEVKEKLSRREKEVEYQGIAFVESAFGEDDCVDDESGRFRVFMDEAVVEGVVAASYEVEVDPELAPDRATTKRRISLTIKHEKETDKRRRRSQIEQLKSRDVEVIEIDAWKVRELVEQAPNSQ